MKSIVRFFTLALLLTALGIAGCLNQESAKYLRYNAKADSFHLLAVYEHFRSSSGAILGGNDAAADKQALEQDLVKLRKMWDARQNMITGYLDLDGPAYAQLTPDRKSLVSDTPQPTDPPIAWDQITIKPGQFFKDASGAVGYWHEIAIPGAVVDQMLARIRANIAAEKDVAAAIDAELQRREASNPPIAPADWVAFGKWLGDEVEKERKGDKPAAEGAADAPDRGKEGMRRLIACFDSKSLFDTRAAVAAAKIGPARSAALLTFHLPLTARDSNGILAIFQQFDRYVTALLDKKEAHDKGAAQGLVMVRDPLKQFATAKTAADGSLDIGIDVPGILNRMSAESRERESKAYAQSPENQARAKAFGTAMEQWKDVKVQTNIDAEKLIGEFTTRDLGK